MEKYIDKSAIVAEIEKRLKANGAFDEVGDEAWAEDKGMCEAYRSILSFINTIEVKEVDLEKEIDDYINEHFSECGDGVLINNANSLELTLFDVIPMAKYFFELGLKVQKGE